MKGRTAVIAALTVLAAAATARADFQLEAGSPYTTAADSYGVVTADVNTDGRPDVAVVNGTSSNVSVFLRQPAGAFAQEAGSPFTTTPGGGPNLAASGDFNGDGRPDLAVSNFVTGTVTILLRDSAGGYTQGQAISVGVQLTGIAAGFFDPDTLADLAILRNDGLLQVQRGVGNGTFTLEANYAVGAAPADVATGDFNNDNRIDLAVANSSGNSVTVLLRNALGTAFTTEATIPVAGRPLGIAAANLDGVGGEDLAVTAANAGTVSVLLRNAANNGFTLEGAPIPVPAGPIGIVANNFDDDLRVDLAVASNGGAVTILRRQPLAGYAQVQSIAMTRAYRLAVADFDADGRADLAVSMDGPSSGLNILVNPAPQQPPPDPTPTPTPTATPTPLPTPTAGRNVNAEPKSGTVTIRRPGSRRFTRLREGEQIPVGTTVDTRKGRVTIIASGGRSKPTVQADFFSGIFRLSQTRTGTPTTTLTLTEALDCTSKKARAAAKKPKKRRLWGDGKGKFRTKGRYAAATVRGTRWLVEDRCDSTLTRVTVGSVSVRDEVKKKTVIVRKGKSYTARKKR